MNKRYGSAFGLFDVFLAVMFLWSALLLIGGLGNLGSDMTCGAILWLLMTGPAYAWRRGWIQRTIAHQKRVQQEQAAAARRAEAARSTQTTAATPTAGQGWSEETFYPFYAIKVPTTTQWQPGAASTLLRALLQKSGTRMLRLAIVANENDIEWQIMFQRDAGEDVNLEEVKHAVATTYKGATVDYAQIPHYRDAVYRRYRIFGVQQTRYFDPALNATKIRGKTDPLDQIINALGTLQKGETARYEVAVFMMTAPTPEEVERVLTVPAREVMEYRRGARNYNNWGEMIGGEVVGGLISVVRNRGLANDRVPIYSDAETERFMQKLSQPLARAVISVTLDSPDKTRLDHLDNLSGAVLELGNEHIAPSIEHSYVSADMSIGSFDDAARKIPTDYLLALAPSDDTEIDQVAPFIFNYTADELAAVWHLPHSELAAGTYDPPPAAVLAVDAPSLAVGQVTVSGVEQAVRVRLNDLKKHMFISGMTGTGKSTLFHNLAHQLAQLGTGFTILDPHGKLIKGILQTSIAEQMQDRILLLELSDDHHPVPLNIFRRTAGVSRSDATSNVLNTIKKLYQQNWSETQMERVYRGFLELVLTDPNATPLDIQELAKINNQGYRNRQLAKALAVTDRKERLSRAARNFWTEYVSASDSNKRKLTDPVINRLNIFLGKKEVELMTCHPGAIDFSQAIADNMIILVDLSGRNIASEAASLGAIIFAELYNTVQAMGYQEDDAAPRHYLIIDEAHRFMTNMVELAFSEVRKFGMPLIMADQWIGQLDQDTQEAIINNSGTTLTFRVNEREAQKTATLFKPRVTSEDVVKFGVGEVALSTQAEGQSVEAFVMRTYDKPQPIAGVLSEAAIRERSRHNLIRLIHYNEARFAGRLLTAEEIEDWLDERYDQPEFDSEVKADEPLVTEVDLKPKRQQSETTGE